MSNETKAEGFPKRAWAWFTGLGKWGKVGVVAGLLVVLALVVPTGEDEPDEPADAAPTAEASPTTAEAPEATTEPAAAAETTSEAPETTPEPKSAAPTEEETVEEESTEEQVVEEGLTGAEVEQALKDAFGVSDFRELESWMWGYYIADVEYDRSIIRVTLQVDGEDPVAADSSRAIFSLIGEQFEDADWVEVMDASGVHIEQTMRSDVPLLNQ